MIIMLALIDTNHKIVLLFLKSWCRCRGLMVSVLNSRTSGLGSKRGLEVRDIVLCSWAGHLTEPLPTWVYKWVAVHLMLGVYTGWNVNPLQG